MHDTSGRTMDDQNMPFPILNIIPLDDGNDDPKSQRGYLSSPESFPIEQQEEIHEAISGDPHFLYQDSIGKLADAACLTLSSAIAVIERESGMIRRQLYPTSEKRIGDDINRSSKRHKRSSDDVHLEGIPENVDSSDETKCSHSNVPMSPASRASLFRRINRMKRMSSFLRRIDHFHMKLLAEIQSCSCDAQNEDNLCHENEAGR